MELVEGEHATVRRNSQKLLPLYTKEPGFSQMEELFENLLLRFRLAHSKQKRFHPRQAKLLIQGMDLAEYGDCIHLKIK